MISVWDVPISSSSQFYGQAPRSECRSFLLPPPIDQKPNSHQGARFLIFLASLLDTVSPSTISPTRLVLLDSNLAVSDNLRPILIKAAISNNLVTSNSRKNLCPETPVHTSQDQNTDTNNRENVVRIPIRVDISIRWNERDKGEEDVGENVDDRDGEVGVPRGRPVLRLFVMEVDETSGDETVDPRAGICVPELLEIISRAAYKHTD